MNIPKAGDRWRGRDGTIYIAGEVFDLTQDDEFAPGDCRFLIILETSDSIDDMSAIGVGELSEDEFVSFCSDEGLTSI